jgi:hypothetical protein
VQEIRFSQLSRPKQTVIRLCQRANYGSIQNVEVVNGDVCFNTPPEVLLDIKLDSEVTPRSELHLTDFALPIESFRLVAQIDLLTNGVVSSRPTAGRN